MIEGSIAIEVDKKRYVLREGNSAQFNSNRPHTYSSNASRDAALLCAHGCDLCRGNARGRVP